MHSLELQILPALVEPDRGIVLHTYTKFMVVREPFARLLSCYLDKFTPIVEFGELVLFKHLAMAIVRVYRNRTSPAAESPDVGGAGSGEVEDLPDSHPTFEEFLRFVVAPDQRRVRRYGSGLFVHFHQLCFCMLFGVLSL